MDSGIGQWFRLLMKYGISIRFCEVVVGTTADHDDDNDVNDDFL